LTTAGSTVPRNQRNRGEIVASRRQSDRRGTQLLGVGLLILSILHVPLPQADYHNIRHHDAPGEICVYHDHLLRWHPAADHDDDVSVLHWHWFVPSVELGNPQRPSSDDQKTPGSAPAMHAHIGEWLQGADWRNEPVLEPGAGGRVLTDSALGLSVGCSAHSSAELVLGPHPDRFSARLIAPADGLRAARTTLFHRWNC
jgi:hypothetical protein